MQNVFGGIKNLYIFAALFEKSKKSYLKWIH